MTSTPLYISSFERLSGDRDRLFLLFGALWTESGIEQVSRERLRSLAAYAARKGFLPSRTIPPRAGDVYMLLDAFELQGLIQYTDGGTRLTSDGEKHWEDVRARNEELYGQAADIVQEWSNEFTAL